MEESVLKRVSEMEESLKEHTLLSDIVEDAETKEPLVEEGMEVINPTQSPIKPSVERNNGIKIVGETISSPEQDNQMNLIPDEIEPVEEQLSAFANVQTELKALANSNIPNKIPLEDDAKPLVLGSVFSSMQLNELDFERCHGSVESDGVDSEDDEEEFVEMNLALFLEL
jgi:hypothetical protein